MNNSRELRSIFLALASLILLLILISSMASAASPSIIKTRITTHETAGNPAIYGNTIVWQDYRNGNWDTYIYDISTKKETHTTNKSNQTNPAIYGNRVVWEDYRNGNADIYMQDISTNKQTRITTNKFDQYSPAIYGDKIVWVEGRNGGKLDEYGNPARDEDWHIIGKLDIFMYDLATHKETQITTSGTAYEPDIYGNKVVWTDCRSIYPAVFVSDIYMYDLDTKKETQITTSELANNPAIYSNRIVWEDTRFDYSPSGIYMYNLSTHKETRIPAEIAHKPGIYGSKIVYEDGRYDSSGNTDIFMYDLSTNVETMITPWDMEHRGDDPYYEQDDPYQTNPAIYGDRIVYEQGDIYMATLSYPPVAAFSASPLSGKAPLTVRFTDKSTGTPTSWSWNFGDKTASTIRNPVHKYTKAGKYTVSLKVKNAAGNNTAKKTNYITVK